MSFLVFSVSREGRVVFGGKRSGVNIRESDGLFTTVRTRKTLATRFLGRLDTLATGQDKNINI